jgi:hypothetical protein
VQELWQQGSVYEELKLKESQLVDEEKLLTSYKVGCCE